MVDKLLLLILGFIAIVVTIVLSTMLEKKFPKIGNYNIKDTLGSYLKHKFINNVADSFLLSVAIILVFFVTSNLLSQSLLFILLLLIITFIWDTIIFSILDLLLWYIYHHAKEKTYSKAILVLLIASILLYIVSVFF